MMHGYRRGGFSRMIGLIPDEHRCNVLINQKSEL
jgi:hypothetical protein